MGFFITFEGIEGSGKSTQITLLRQALERAGHVVLQTREPGGCDIADQIRRILLHPQNTALEPTAELLLYAAARAQHVCEIIRPALQQGHIVLCDRYTDATLTYQGDGRQLDRQLISQLNYVATQETSPDLTMLIDLKVETGLGRAFAREIDLQDSSEGRFEREEIAFHQRVREGYLKLAAAEPHRFRQFDGALSIDLLAAKIEKTTFDFIAQSKGQL
ncbi:dTMP kinase [Geopsychrobacter electrodiphilus]|uniref:dTMP kinase n=1 Tax=Geopsychrobacter electrodiphilus TaxID=225196 RepID=UPI0003615EDE|nr:dTMP kinase [Geopsychrobacter electrodiphilus]